MSNSETIDEMNLTITDVNQILKRASFNQDPVRKIQLVRQALKDLKAFDAYWSDTFNNA